MREISAQRVQEWLTDRPDPSDGMMLMQYTLGVANRMDDAFPNRRDNRKDVETAAAQLAERVNIPGAIYQNPYNENGRGTDAIVVMLDESNDDGYVSHGNSYIESEANLDSLLQIARAGFLPNYYKEIWLEREAEGSPKHQLATAAGETSAASQSSDDAAAANNAAASDDAAANNAAASDDAAANANANASETVPVAANAGDFFPALAEFVGKNKGGLANDPDETEAIEELQTFLVSLGLNVGNNGVDGRYGPRTTQAVKDFQAEIVDLVQDGDAGPNTINAMTTVAADFARMEELLRILDNTSVTDGLIPVFYKSGISKLLERELSDSERAELQRLLGKYENFIERFPTYQQPIVNRATEVVSGEATSSVSSVSSAPAQVTYNADTPLEDLKLTVPEDAGRSQTDAITEYNTLIDEEKFEEAANMLRDNEAIAPSTIPEGLEDELRRRASETATQSSTSQTTVTGRPETPVGEIPAAGSQTITGVDGDAELAWTIDQANNRVTIETGQTRAEMNLVFDSLELETESPIVYIATIADGENQGVGGRLSYANRPNLLNAWVPLINGLRTPEELQAAQEDFYGITNETQIERVDPGQELNGIIQLSVQNASLDTLYVTKRVNQDGYTFYPVPDELGRKRKTLAQVREINTVLGNILAASFMRNGDVVPIDRTQRTQLLVNPQYTGTFVENARLFFRTDMSEAELDRLLDQTRENMNAEGVRQEELRRLYIQVYDFGRTFRGAETVTFPGLIVPRADIDPNADDPLAAQQQEQQRRDQLSRKINDFLREVRDARDGRDDEAQSELRSRLNGYSTDEQNIIIAVWQEVDRNFGSDDNRVLNALLQIRTPDQWNKINTGYEILSGGRSIFIDLDSTWTFSQASMNRLRNHLRDIRVLAVGETVEDELVSLYKRMSKL